jgi:hypothetical protein
VLAALQLPVILGQLFYWLVLKDDGREQIIWDACLYPGGKVLP